MAGFDNNVVFGEVGLDIGVHLNTTSSDASVEFVRSGGDVTSTVNNTSDTASSDALFLARVEGTSAGDPYIRFAIGSSDSYSLGIDNSSLNNDVLVLNYNEDGDCSPSNNSIQIFRVDSLDPVNGRARLLVHKDLAVADATASGISVLLHCQNANTDVNSDAQFLLESADPNLGAGGGAQYIRWGSPNQVQFQMGMGKDATPSTQPLEVKGGTAAFGGSSLFTFHPGVEGNIACGLTGAFSVHSGTTGERPSAPVNGMVRYNSTTASFEGYQNGSWQNLILDTPVSVPDGGSARVSSTAFAVICGGISSTAPHQSIASVGSANDVLTSNGVGALPTFQAAAGGGSWVHLASTTASNDASVVFDNTLITSTFNNYVVLMDGIVPITDSVYLILDISEDNGSTWLNSGFNSGAKSLATGIASSVNTTTFIMNPNVASNRISNTALAGLTGNVYMMNFTSGGTPHVQGTSFMPRDNADFPNTNSCGGIGPATTTVNAIRFIMSSGNVSTGEFNLYGIVNT